MHEQQNNITKIFYEKKKTNLLKYILHIFHFYDEKFILFNFICVFSDDNFI